MREAIGGSMLFYIVITLLVLYIVFISFIMNYASTYRAANYVISQIEMCNGDLSDCKGQGGVSVTTDTICTKIKNYYNFAGNIKNVGCSQNTNGAVYRITMGLNFTLPFVGNFDISNISVETKTIYNVTCGDIQGSCFKS